MFPTTRGPEFSSDEAGQLGNTTFAQHLENLAHLPILAQGLIDFLYGCPRA